MDGKPEKLLNIYFVGDSHTLPCKNLYFREPWAGSPVAVRTQYVDGLTSNAFFNKSTKEFSAKVFQFWNDEGIVWENEPAYLSRDERQFSRNLASGEPATAPLMMFSLGDIDVRGSIMPLLKDSYDFVFPHMPNLPLRSLPILPWNILEKQMREHIAPYIIGLKQLIDCGLNRIYVQAVVPPSKNEALVTKLHGYSCPHNVRSKLVLAYNSILEEQCKTIGATFLNVWDQLTDESGLRDEYELDGVHLTVHGAKLYIDKLLEHAANVQWHAVNHVRYDMYYRMACGLSPNFQ